MLRRVTDITRKLRFQFSRNFSSSSSLKLEMRDNHSYWIVLDRPKLHNAFNEDVIAELTNAFKHVPAEARSVVLAANGPSFSAGADLNWMKKMANYTKEENEKDAQALFDMFHNIRYCPVPVIARVSGAALGGGSGLVAACDMAFSVKSAVFGFTECRLGLIPAVISPFVMEKIGSAHASRYFLTAARFSADEARRINLVHEVVENPEALDKLVSETVSTIAQNSPAAVRRSKQLIAGVLSPHNGPTLSEKKGFVAREIAQVRISAEGQEGLKAFFEKRNPAWVAAAPQPKL